jgi:5-methylcytosine-specific restriction endonuclease McrA
MNYQYNQYICNWRLGVISGSRGVLTQNLSAHVVRYIREKYNNKCARCGWCEVNPRTRQPPLEIEHMDGDVNNNNEANLILLCPNCHSLTTTYKNLNKGHGRLLRNKKYVRIV